MRTRDAVADVEPEPQHELFTRRQAAEYLRVVPRTIWNMVHDGRLRAYQLGGKNKSIRIFREDLLAILVPIVPAKTRPEVPA